MECAPRAPGTTSSRPRARRVRPEGAEDQTRGVPGAIPSATRLGRDASIVVTSSRGDEDGRRRRREGRLPHDDRVCCDAHREKPVLTRRRSRVGRASVVCEPPDSCDTRRRCVRRGGPLRRRTGSAEPSAGRRDGGVARRGAREESRRRARCAGARVRARAAERFRKNVAHYCSKACQARHWGRHRDVCPAGLAGLGFRRRETACGEAPREPTRTDANRPLASA